MNEQLTRRILLKVVSTKAAFRAGVSNRPTLSNQSLKETFKIKDDELWASLSFLCHHGLIKMTVRSWGPEIESTPAGGSAVQLFAKREEQKWPFLREDEVDVPTPA